MAQKARLQVFKAVNTGTVEKKAHYHKPLFSFCFQVHQQHECGDVMRGVGKSVDMQYVTPISSGSIVSWHSLYPTNGL
jgi:hypothetical protein